MPAHEEEDKQSMQKNLLQELRDLQSVLDADNDDDDDIPVLSDVIDDSPANDTSAATGDTDVSAAAPDDEQNHDDDGVPLLDDSVPVLDNVAESTTNESSAESPAVEEKVTRPSPFALVEGASNDYDSSAAESLIEEGLTEALQPLTAQMDDAALRLVDELVAEHAELIRQQLKLKLAAKSQQLFTDGGDATP